MNIQSCKADEGTCGVTKDDLSFKSASRSVNELVFDTVVKIMLWYVDEQKCVCLTLILLGIDVEFVLKILRDFKGLWWNGILRT